MTKYIYGANQTKMASLDWIYKVTDTEIVDKNGATKYKIDGNAILDPIDRTVEYYIHRFNGDVTILDRHQRPVYYIRGTSIDNPAFDRVFEIYD